MNRKGFTLAEIMIVVAILALLTAIAVPNLIRARMSANEATAIGALKTLVTAAQTFRASNPGYPLDLSELFNGWTPPYIDNSLAGGTKQGYVFLLSGTDDNGSGFWQGFTATAVPVTPGTTGQRRFFVDTSGVIRFNVEDVATSSDEPIQ
jgi:type IV pilus assembly protein PilA